jgi:hypothetical protein
MAEKITSLDEGYTFGDLSIYPEAVDPRDSLYIATNNGETTLRQSLSFNAKRIHVEDASKFPAKGILKLGPPPGEVGSFELVYYEKRSDTVFEDLDRGYAGSRQTHWKKGDYVTHAVGAEHHNILRDAVFNIETNLGTIERPVENSLNELLITLEQKWLAPRPMFRAAPWKAGPPPLTIRFQNFTMGHALRFLWDFGDGSSSDERSPIHTYADEGVYTVRLEIITTEGATGVVTKQNYISVSNDEIIPFFYVLPLEGTTAYSIETAAELGVSPTVFEFVDQTNGEITERFWIFDDGTSETVIDPNIHATTHVYEFPGVYEPSLIMTLVSGVPRRGFAEEKIIVL